MPASTHLYSDRHTPPPSLHATASPSSNKRKRTTPTPKPTKSSGKDTAAMYTFTSRHAPSGVVDLTASPPSRRPTNLNSATGAKKLVVKNLRTSGQGFDARGYLEKIWSSLERGLDAIFSDHEAGAGAGFSREELYRGVENVCRQGGASTLYGRLEGRCKREIERVRVRLVEEAGDEDVEVLGEALEAWRVWKERMGVVRGVFFFLERSYLLASSKATLAELTTSLFRDVVFLDRELKGRIVGGACELMARERQGRADGELEVFRQAVGMFHELAVYTANFEGPLLLGSQQYVDQWATETSQREEVPGYVGLAGECIAAEMRRCEDFALSPSTRRELLAILEGDLIEKKKAYLTDYKALSSLLDANNVDGLTTLYALLDRRRLGSELREPFDKWVDETGTSVVFAKDAEDMVIHLLSLKKRLDHIWKVAFQRNESIGHGLRETFQTFMNKTKKGEATWGTDNTKVGEMIAKYVDTILRGGAKAIPTVLTTARRSSTTTIPAPLAGTEVAADEEAVDEESVDEDAEINIQLDQVLDLFRFVQGKAVFEAFYKKDLARRLLMSRSASADAERSMLTRLKTECGSGFTQNLEQMFKDVELSREEMGAYRQRLEERVGFEKGKALDLSVNILSAAAWPSYPDIPVIIPPGVKRAIEGFEMHYKSKHSGRKLDWKHALAHCQMRANFPSGAKELVVSSFQAIVLVLFNNLPEGEKLFYADILAQTGLPEPELKRTLQSLACARLQPLRKHPRSRDISPTDTFTVNTSFTHKLYRVKINAIQLKETAAENKETHIRVAEDRNFETQAAIVRIMKARKKIGHAELVGEVVKATISRGVLDVRDIKRNVDRLIEKDYMEREEGGGYAYVA
nr:hypothetical protein B0A51_02622 [Rachicladosporium sp. CCFEE 5018]